VVNVFWTMTALENPLSKRAIEDKRQTNLIKEAWKESGKVYGYRKLHDDLCDQGETCCPNRVARLSRLAGIRAQIGYRRRPGKYGGKPSIVVAPLEKKVFSRALVVCSPFQADEYNFNTFIEVSVSLSAYAAT
jgi:transposase InsO family protein